MKRALLLLTAVLLGAFLATGIAQSFPTHPVKIVVPYPPGGLLDVLARALGAELQGKWSQPVIIENVAGAGSIIGAERVASAPPDGHTLLMTIDQTLVGNSSLYKKLPYDPNRSFAPITMLARSAQLVLAHPSVPASSMRELVETMHREPGKMSYGSYGTGTQPHLLFELLKSREHVDLLHVPYKGVAPALLAATAGEVQLTIASPGLGGQLVKAGKLKALMFASSSRSKLLPDVPTAAEAGYPYAVSSTWFALFAPAGTSAVLVEKIRDDVTTIARRPDFLEKQITARGFELVAGTPAELSASIREDAVRFAEMARTAGVQPE